jgi:hypothetical protein
LRGVILAYVTTDDGTFKRTTPSGLRVPTPSLQSAYHPPRFA